MRYILTVSQINKYIKEIMSKDLILSNLWVKGEISNFKNHYSGHMYFTLKDENSLLKCVMFKTYNAALKFVPENGMKVIMQGAVSVFERDGQYQLYVESMQPDGLGDLHLAFEQLKKKLSEEGLFDRKYKKSLPFLPQSIGVVTSSTGAVVKDIIHILNRRYPNIALKIFPVAVQGETAPKQIARAIEKLNSLGNVDVIILARGGGSLEELWAFNEEVVARSIFKSQIPVISAIGHETDYTIADFVADVRAPTPSAAAEIVIPEKVVLQSTIAALDARLKKSLNQYIIIKRNRFEKVMNSFVFKQPFDKVYQERMRLDVVNKYLYRAFHENIGRNKTRFTYLLGKLDALSPLTVLARGYSIVKKSKTGDIIKSVQQVKPGDDLEISVGDGRIDCLVKTTGGSYE